ncbi:4141_t:CDS:2 [Funneliformis geosporum]|nr:4141_t:CDS:2 [Funneliformis geosporum]
MQLLVPGSVGKNRSDTCLQADESTSYCQEAGFLAQHWFPGYTLLHIEPYPSDPTFLAEFFIDVVNKLHDSESNASEKLINTKIGTLPAIHDSATVKKLHDQKSRENSGTNKHSPEHLSSCNLKSRRHELLPPYIICVGEIVNGDHAKLHLFWTVA